MHEMIFLWLLALVYIIFAVIQDIKKKEIANWLSFSLIIFALGFRFFYSLFQGQDFTFFYNGVIGLGIFFAIGNILYYGRIFAGGDAKLMIALGTIIPYYPEIFSNFQIFFNFLIIFLFVGFIYVLTSSAVLCIRHFKSFKKEFSKQLKRNKKLMLVLISFSIIILIFGFLENTNIFFIFGVLIFFSSYLYLYAKAIDEACMVKKIKTKNLREGDWLYSDLKLGRKKLKSIWEGVNKKDINEISKRYKEVKIRQGIAFSPVFLISFIIFIILTFLDVKLWNPFW
jgi:Flp pilus assembly protein protease CpaA